MRNHRRPGRPMGALLTGKALRRRRAFTLIEAAIAIGVSGFITVAAIGTFVFIGKSFAIIDSETRERHRVVRVMDTLKSEIMNASTRAVYPNHTSLETEVGAGSPGRYLRIRVPSENLWHIFYFDDGKLYRAQGATLPAPNPATQEWQEDIDNASFIINPDDGNVHFSVRVIPESRFTGNVMTGWIQMDSRIFPRNYVDGN